MQITTNKLIGDVDVLFHVKHIASEEKALLLIPANSSRLSKITEIVQTDPNAIRPEKKQ